MKEAFEVFKLDDGTYFVGYSDRYICTTDKLIRACWFGIDLGKYSKHEVDLLRGKFITVTISDDEQQPTFSARKEPATFKGKIAMIKREQNLSEETLSSMLGCGKSTVHDWLHGSVPSRKFRKKIEGLYKSYYEE